MQTHRETVLCPQTTVHTEPARAITSQDKGPKRGMSDWEQDPGWVRGHQEPVKAAECKTLWKEMDIPEKPLCKETVKAKSSQPPPHLHLIISVWNYQLRANIPTPKAFCMLRFSWMIVLTYSRVYLVYTLKRHSLEKQEKTAIIRFVHLEMLSQYTLPQNSLNESKIPEEICHSFWSFLFAGKSSVAQFYN